MKEKSVVFKMEHLDQFAIIEEPCTVVVRVSAKLSAESLYGDAHPRWIVNLKAITRGNLNMLRTLSETQKQITYYDMSHLLLSGCIWENQISNIDQLPVKGEEVIAVFGWVSGAILCTNLTLIPRKQPKLYLHATAVYDELKEFEQIIKQMNDE